MTKKDPYQVLGIGSDATEGEGKKNYRLLSFKYHPDRNPGDEAAKIALKEVQDAWEILKDILPKSATPLDIPDGATAEEIADIYVAWLLKNPEPAKSKKPAAATAQQPDVQNRNTWSTVASETTPGTAMAPPAAASPKDWRHQNVRRWKSASGLERITADEAANLIYGRPNAFAALKIVQQLHPELCLYDAILSRAKGAFRQAPSGAASSKSSSRALVIIGAESVDTAACDAALKDPLASVEMAANIGGRIAPQIRLESASVSPQKLAMDLLWLKENIMDLIEKSAPRPGHHRGGGTSLTSG